jgi:Holliday junction resolvase RusA-like endonuclease
MTYTPKDTVKWERAIAACARATPPARLLDGPLRARMVFHLPKPKSKPKKQIYPDTKPDWDNLGKSVTDALEGLVFTNDSRFCKVFVEKIYGDPPRVEIMLEEIEE